MIRIPMKRDAKAVVPLNGGGGWDLKTLAGPADTGKVICQATKCPPSQRELNPFLCPAASLQGTGGDI